MDNATFIRFEDAQVIETRKGFHNQYFGERASRAPGPQAFMVNYPAGIGAPAHFHHVNQFQVFFGLPGCTYQRHEIGSVMLHYAQADTLYGPFSAGESSTLKFMTLRQHGNDFTGVMPDNKDLLPRGVHHTHLQQELASWAAQPLPGEHESGRSEVFPVQPDGVCAFGVLAGAGASIEGPSAQGSGGQYYVVVSGSAEVGGDELSELSVGWCPADADAPTLVAGKNGLRLLILQFGPESGDDSTRTDAAAALGSRTPLPV